MTFQWVFTHASAALSTDAITIVFFASKFIYLPSWQAYRCRSCQSFDNERWCSVCNSISLIPSLMKQRSWTFGRHSMKVKVKVQYLIQRCSTMNTCSGALYNLESGSWLAWANDAAAHYVVFHCPRTIGPAVQHADILPPQSAGLHPVARKLLLISRPAKSRRLSWPEHTVG